MKYSLMYNKFTEDFLLTLPSILVFSCVLTSDGFWSTSVYSCVQDILESVLAVPKLDPKLSYNLRGV